MCACIHVLLWCTWRPGINTFCLTYFLKIGSLSGLNSLVKSDRLAMSSRNWPGSALPVLVLEACLAFVGVPEIRIEVLTLECQCSATCYLSDRSLSWNYVKVFLCTCACLHCLCMCACVCTRESKNMHVCYKSLCKHSNSFPWYPQGIGYQNLQIFNTLF